MPPTPPAGNAVTGTPDQPGAPGTRAPAPATPGPRQARPLLPRRAQTARPAAARSDRTGSARTEIRGDRLRRVPTTGGHRDPLFERPDLVEDDYYRFRNQPSGW
jgi:hypothetical protein